MIGTLDLMLRGAGVGAVAVTIVLMLRQYRGTVAGRLGTAFGVVVIASVLCPLCQLWGVGYWGLPIYFGCFAVAGMFWLFVRAWFDDGFKPRLIHWLAVAGLVALHLWRHGAAILAENVRHSMPGDDLAGALNALPYLADLAFVGAALARARAGKANDLDESRRRFRDLIVSAIGGYMLLVAGINIYLFYRRPAPLLDFVILVGTVVLIFAFLLMTARLENRLFVARARLDPAPTVSTTDELLLAALTRFMNEEKGFRQPGLTIAALAERLGCPEYRLRRLINGRLGHRNFNDFVNGYRLAEARRRLSDPEAARLPVLTIALDAGFQSIGPFNRAFKDDTGMTPVEFRCAQLGKNG
jgi:AraC-like DNA-binding protein